MKNLKFCIPALFFIGVLIFSNCKKEEPEQVNPYIGCCGTAPIIDSIGDLKVYIPNIFSPNHDGINDIFTVHIDSPDDSVQIRDFFLFNSQADTVFALRKIKFRPRLNVALRDQRFVEIERGFYTYSLVIVKETGQSKKVVGGICALLCKEDGGNDDVEEAINFFDCTWATQSNGVGGYDPESPSFESCER